MSDQPSLFGVPTTLGQDAAAQSKRIERVPLGDVYLVPFRPLVYSPCAKCGLTFARLDIDDERHVLLDLAKRSGRTAPRHTHS